jgi:hypothetical protein
MYDPESPERCVWAHPARLKPPERRSRLLNVHRRGKLIGPPTLKAPSQHVAARPPLVPVGNRHPLAADKYVDRDFRPGEIDTTESFGYLGTAV